MTMRVCGAKLIPTAPVAIDDNVICIDVDGVIGVLGIRLIPVSASSTRKVPLVGAAGLPFLSNGEMVR